MPALYTHTVLIGLGTGRAEGHHGDQAAAERAARTYSATVTGLIVAVVSPDNVIVAAFEHGEAISVERAQLVAREGYAAASQPDTRTCRKCRLAIELIGGTWIVMGTGTTADGLSYCPPNPDAAHVGEHQPTAARYRVHIYDCTDQGRWIASRTFGTRPDQETVNAAFTQLRGPGWFEVRVNRLAGDGELALTGWTQENGTPGRKT